jgi:hypothetical protein
MGGYTSGVVNPMRASGGLAPTSLLEVLTASNTYYAWSDRDLQNGSAILSQNTTPIATITANRRLIGLFGGEAFPSFTVVLTGPAPISAGEPVTIAGNTLAAANGTWIIAEVLSADSYLVEHTTTGGSGTGGTSSTPGGSNVDYKGWIIGQPKFTLTGTTQTDTGTIDVQNYSGNTVMRDVATAFSEDEFIGAFIYFRLWRSDSEYAVFTFMGTVSECDVSDDRMTLALEGFGNWSNCIAPACNIDATCGLTFGSVECGSTSPTPCQNTYGTCTSIERFKGTIAQWDWANQGASLVQIAQPPPVISHNPARAF